MNIKTYQYRSQPTNESPSIGIVPCAAEKAETARPAKDLYLTENFRGSLAGAEEQFDTVLIFSAKYGLVDLDQEIEPYECKIGDGSDEEISLEELAEQIEGIFYDYDFDVSVFGMLPKAYLRKLDTAARMIGGFIEDVYEGNRGIGDQRGIAKSCREFTKEKLAKKHADLWSN